MVEFAGKRFTDDDFNGIIACVAIGMFAFCVGIGVLFSSVALTIIGIGVCALSLAGITFKFCGLNS